MGGPCADQCQTAYSTYPVPNSHHAKIAASLPPACSQHWHRQCPTPAPCKGQPRLTHAAEAGKGKSDKAQFRRESTRPTVDLHPHKLETFKTTKAKHHYKFKNPH